MNIECIGGGRIKVSDKSILVYGYSKGYGQCDHTLTVELLKEVYPHYDITYSNDGY